MFIQVIRLWEGIAAAGGGQVYPQLTAQPIALAAEHFAVQYLRYGPSDPVDNMAR